LAAAGWEWILVQKLGRFVAVAWVAGVPQRAFAVALIVGTTLNLINQSEAIFGGGRINWGKLALTYTIPFLVSAHGALSASRK
jgi:hypothetical protein